jgi:DNA replication protein DnaC
MLNKELHKLAKALSLTDHVDAEPYTLTPEEEEKAISLAVEQAQKFMAWKMRKVLKTEDEIWHKISLIDWNEKVDRGKVLALANLAKNRELWQKAQREAERQRQVDRLKELQSYWAYGRIYRLMKHNSVHAFGKELDETPENLPVIKALCFFIARDDRFATELNYDRLKGLLIRGPSGTGKTHLVRCCEDNGLNPIATLSMIDITDAVKADGSYRINNPGKSIIYLDDVGTEEASVKHFGTMIQWFKNFIETVYLRAKCYNHLIITTNLNFKAIEEHYGYRVASRMREMFNVIDLTGKDRRR